MICSSELLLVLFFCCTHAYVSVSFSVHTNIARLPTFLVNLAQENSCHLSCHRAHLLKKTVANRSFIVYMLDLLSIPEYVIKKGRPHGHRYGKLPENKEYHLPHYLKKRCKKRDYKGIHDRFLRDHVFRERMIENSRDEGCLSRMGRSCRTRSHLSNVRIRILSQQAELVDLSQ